MAMGHNVWLQFGVDEHPLASYFYVHQVQGFDLQPYKSTLIIGDVPGIRGESSLLVGNTPKKNNKKWPGHARVD